MVLAVWLPGRYKDGLAGRLPDVSLADFRDRLPTLMAGRSESTIHKTAERLRLLGDLCGARALAAVDRAHVMGFRAKRLASGVSAVTVNKDLRQIRSALSYAVDAGLLRANPLFRWKGLMLREPEKQMRGVEETEFAKLTKACDNPSVRCLLTVAYRQGLRRRVSNIGSLPHLAAPCSTVGEWRNWQTLGT